MRILEYQLLLKYKVLYSCFDILSLQIVFSDAWWIGSKEENPEEIQLSFPENMKTVGVPVK